MSRKFVPQAVPTSFPTPAYTTDAVPAPFNLSSPCSDPILLNRFYLCLQQSRQHEERIRGLERECAQIFDEWRTAMPQANDVITVPPLSPLSGTTDPFEQKMEAEFMRCPRLRVLCESLDQEHIKLFNVKREMALYEQMLLLLGVPIPEAVYQNPKVMKFGVSPDVPVVLECQSSAEVPVVEEVFVPTCVPCPEVVAVVCVPSRVPCQQVVSPEKVVAVPVIDEVFVPNRVPGQEIVFPYPQKSDFRQDAESPVVEEVIDTPRVPRQEHRPRYSKIKTRRVKKVKHMKQCNVRPRPVSKSPQSSYGNKSQFRLHRSASAVRLMTRRKVTKRQHSCSSKPLFHQLLSFPPGEQVRIMNLHTKQDPIRDYLVQIDRNGKCC